MVNNNTCLSCNIVFVLEFFGVQNCGTMFHFILFARIRNTSQLYKCLSFASVNYIWKVNEESQ